MMGVLLLVVMTPLAQPVWEALPPLAVIQFPWRLLALAGFLFSALGGLLLANLALDDFTDEVEALLAAATGVRRGPAGGLFVFALLGIFASWPYLQASLSPVEGWREDGRAIFRFEQEHPDMIAYTEWVTQPFTSTVMSAGYAAPGYAEDHGYTTSLDRLQICRRRGDRNQSLQPRLERRRRGRHGWPRHRPDQLLLFPGLGRNGRRPARPDPTVANRGYPDRSRRRAARDRGPFWRHTPAHVGRLHFRRHAYRRGWVNSLARQAA